MEKHTIHEVQSCVEHLHLSQKYKLICDKIDKGDKFNLCFPNNSILFDCNNIIHTSTGFKPIEIFYSTSDKNFG